MGVGVGVEAAAAMVYALTRESGGKIERGRARENERVRVVA